MGVLVVILWDVVVLKLLVKLLKCGTVMFDRFNLQPFCNVEALAS